MVYDVDVLVAGGGPAGIAAAVAAARNGANTMVFDGQGCFGGMGTSGLVPCFCPYTTCSKEPIIEGIGAEVLQRLHEKGGGGPDKARFNWVPIDPEKLKLVYDELANEAGARILFYTRLASAVTDGDVVQSVFVQNKGGRSAVRAKAFIDCTGDADLAVLAGAEYEQGDEEGNTQAVTLCFTVCGIDAAPFDEYLEHTGDTHNLAKFISRMKEKGELDIPEDRCNAACRPYPDVMGFNYSHVFEVDGTNPDHLTTAAIEGRKMAHQFVEVARRNLPGFERATLIASAPLVGVRETRRIMGEYRLVAEDYYAARHFDDDIACFDFNVDIHAAKRDDRSAEERYKRSQLPQGKHYGIPYRVLLPRGISNLLVAGRSVSCDRTVQGSLRVMPACFAMGQAAGTAAALAVKESKTLRELDIKRLQEILRAQGACIESC